MAKILFLVAVTVLINGVAARIVNKFKCPEVRAVPHFDLEQPLKYFAPKEGHVVYEEFVIHRLFYNTGTKWMLGDWFVVEYYASAEEALSYSCMKSVFAQDDHVPAADGGLTPGVTMNFTYRFADDPLGENLFGNITWRVDLNQPAHWTHAESTYDGIYNTYVLDTEYKTWSLLLHCAEPKDKARYLSAFILSRKTTLPKNVMAYLRDKLPRYDIDMKYVFPIPHDDCKDKPARPDFSHVLVPVDTKKPQKPGVSYNLASDN